MRDLSDSEKSLVDTLLSKGVRVYIKNNDKTATSFIKSGCKIHDFPEGVSEGAGFNLPAIKKNQYEISYPIGEGGTELIHDRKGVARIVGLISCTAIYGFIAREQHHYIELYAHHAKSGTSDPCVTRIRQMLERENANPDFSYVLIYHREMIDHYYVNDITKLLERDGIPAKNHCVIFEKNGSNAYYAGLNGYFGAFINDKPHFNLTLLAHEHIQLSKFQMLLRDYLSKPEKKKVAAIRVMLPAIRPTLTRIFSSFDMQEEFETVIVNFEAIAEKYQQLREEREKVGWFKRKLTASAYKAKPELVQELLQLIELALEQSSVSDTGAVGK